MNLVGPLSPRVKAVVAGGVGLLLLFWLDHLLNGFGPYLLVYLGHPYAHASEVYFAAQFWTFTVPAIALLAYALSVSPAPRWIERIATRLFGARYGVIILAVLVFALILLVSRLVLDGTPITQDEYTYDFIADTLARGRVINPLPDDASFFANEFIVHNEVGRFGKYPIGHPLLLAIGGLVGLRAYVVPLVSMLLLIATVKLGERAYSRRTALLAGCLLAVSPQFLLTATTRMSQPASALFVVLGTVALLTLERRRHWAWALMCGASFGYAVLVRPLPGVLYLPVVAVYMLVRVSDGGWRERLVLWGTAAGGVLLFAAIFLAVNTAQTGHPWRTGYHALHAQAAAHPQIATSIAASSVGAALMRMAMWQGGWPLLLFVALFARRTPQTFLFVALIVANLCYRLIAPKAGTMCTGPIYTYENVPLLALLTADGVGQLLNPAAEAAVRVSRRLVLGFLAAGLVVAVISFWPVQVRSLRAGAAEHNQAYALVDRLGIHHAVVFYETRIQGTWARYLRNPSPEFDDDVLYLRARDTPYAELEAFVKRRMPDRLALVYIHQEEGWGFVELAKLAAAERAGEQRIPRP